MQFDVDCMTGFKCHTRAILDERLVREIFRFKKLFLLQTNADPLRGKSRLVSEMFGISPKTIRDIWNFRTWRHVTLDTEIVSEVFQLDSNLIGISEAPQPEEPDKLQLFLRAPALDLDKFSLLQSAPAKRIGRPPGSVDKCPRRKRKTAAAQMGPSHGMLSLPEPFAELEGDFSAPHAMPFNSKPSNVLPVVLDLQEEDHLARTFPFFLVH